MKLSAKNISVGYHGKKKLFICPENLVLEKGKLTALIGANGAGKSSLIKVLAGVLKPLSGNVFLNEQQISSLGLIEQAKYRAVLFTGRENLPNISVFDFLKIARYAHGKSENQQLESLFFEKLKLVNALDFADKKINELSDGQYQKIALARVLVQETPIIILDEPTAFLDFGTMRFLFEKLMELCVLEGKTILISTHNIEFALNAADNIWLIENNNLITGSPEDLELNGFFKSFRETKLKKQLRKINANNFCIKGNSEATCLLERGLIRQGFSITENAENTLEIKENKIVLNNEKTFETYQTFYKYLAQYTNELQ